MMGAFVCGMGYYTVLWGEIKEGVAQRLDDSRNDSSMPEKVPLLQDKDSGGVWDKEDEDFFFSFICELIST